MDPTTLHPLLPSKPSFLALARETRDQIYHHLFSNTTYIIRSNNHIVNITYGSASPHQFLSPRWLILNKTFLHEALTQFSQHATCNSIIAFADSDTHPMCTYLIQHDTLLLRSVQAVTLDLSSFMNFYANHPLEPADDNDAFMFLEPRDKALDREGCGVRFKQLIPFVVCARDYLPALERISLKMHLEALSWDASPSGIMLSALAALRPLGVGHKSVKIEVTPPLLQSMQGQVPSVAVIAAAWPRSQMLLQYVGWMLTREYKEGASLEEKQKAGEKYQERETFMPVEKATVTEADAVLKRFEELGLADRKRAVREWVNEETGSWHCEISQGSEVLQEPPVSQARGLVAFTAAKLHTTSMNLQMGTLGDIFRKDKAAQRGVVSYSCTSTGELYWIEHEANGVTGYMRDGGEESFHRATRSSGFLGSRNW